jgi:glutathione synthase/RimK-type ligase-like ATP-grasp enzyme
MAMLRLPTEKSKGRANLHAGGIGAGINMTDGITFINSRYPKSVEFSPDNGRRLVGVKIPFWNEIISISRQVAGIVPLVYMGIDFVLDQRYGPQILELNVRPGLEIQNINGEGLRDRLNQLESKI